MKKTFRQGQILNLIREQTIRTQEDLASALKKIGIDVTQVTLSRDMHELGLVKGPQGYQEPQQVNADERTDENSLQWVFHEFVRDVTVAQNIVILKTKSGNAQSVAEALDHEAWPEIVGTIAGENTVFAAAPNSKQALRAKERLLGFLR